MPSLGRAGEAACVSPGDVLDGNRSGKALRPRRLLGREREVVEVTESVATAAVTTLVGPGGVGKTALATCVAAAATAQFSGGVFLVLLGDLRSAELVGAEVAAQVGLARSGGHSFEDALTEWLTDRDVLRCWERALRCRQEIDAVNVGHIHGSTPLNLLAIARVAARQGDLATASKLLREALPMAQQIRDQATAAQIAALLAETSKVEPAQRATLRPEGSAWHVGFNGTSVHMPDMKGLWYLRELVSRPRAPMLAISLVAAPAEGPVPVSDAGPMLDRQALRQYRKRLAELDEALDDAEASHDVARHAKRSAEREALLKELARATGLGGKPRRLGSPTERARLNVTRTIRYAIAHLATTLPELAAHLDESLATGASCCYEPRANVVWTT